MLDGLREDPFGFRKLKATTSASDARSPIDWDDAPHYDFRDQ
ncbi:MAG TPA: hypothetical protein VH414_01920 [Lichenihabitans sp.]|nr:hypothetical protein [Lichenihabitans sp.]